MFLGIFEDLRSSTAGIETVKQQLSDETSLQQQQQTKTTTLVPPLVNAAAAAAANSFRPGATGATSAGVGIGGAAHTPSMYAALYPTGKRTCHYYVVNPMQCFLNYLPKIFRLLMIEE